MSPLVFLSLTLSNLSLWGQLGSPGSQILLLLTHLLHSKTSLTAAVLMQAPKRCDLHEANAAKCKGLHATTSSIDASLAWHDVKWQCNITAIQRHASVEMGFSYNNQQF